MASLASPSGGDEAHPVAAPATTPAKLRPSRVWYLAALLVFLAGAAWAVVGVVTLNNKIDSFQRMAFPGTSEITLDHRGGYVIYYEGPDGNVPAFDLTVTPVAAPAAVESLDTYSNGLTYSFGSREGSAVITLDVAQPGRFLFEATGAPAVPGGSSLAVGSSIAGSIVRIAVPATIAILAAIGGAIAIALVRRSRAKRARSPAPLPSP
jgi:hypothetical protein